MKKWLFIMFVFLTINSFGQKKIRRTNNFSSYKEHAHEIGYGVNLTYLRFNRSFAPQLHLHYAYYISDFFSVGAGYGGIISKSFYNTFNFETSFRIYEKVIISFKPGLTLKLENGKNELLYSLGLETNYEIKVSENIHVGPLFEITMLQDEVSYVAGFHMGYSF